MSLITLPNEILIIITDSLKISDIHSLLLTSRVLSLVLSQVMYRLAADDQNYNISALFHAAVHRNGVLATTILSRGQNITVMKDHRRVMLPYHTAPAPCSDATLNFVLAQGPNLVIKPGFGKSQWHALHWAAWRKDERFVRLLLERGADIDLKDTTGRTVLHDTIWRGDTILARLLLELGADAVVRDPYGRTAVELAHAYGYREIIHIILEVRPDLFRGRGRKDSVTPIILSATISGDEELVRLLAAGGAYLEIKDESGRTPLHIAAKDGHISIVQILIDHGALLNTRDIPSHFKEEISRLLIEKGANPNHINTHNPNAEYVAVQPRRSLRGSPCQKPDSRAPPHSTYDIDGLSRNYPDYKDMLLASSSHY